MSPILGVARLRRLLARIDRCLPVGERVAAASRQLLGRRYVQNPLAGSAEAREVLAVTVDGFDCVTFVETALALALARTPQRFVATLRRIRYRDGRVEWIRRNHYMTGWIRSNVRAGLLRRASLRGPSVVRVRDLAAVPGLPKRRARVRCRTKRTFWHARGAARTGDVICFVSTRRDLDVFHVGILARSGSELVLRHASRSRGRVVEQDLAGFLQEHAMAGVIVVRPVDHGGRAKGA